MSNLWVMAVINGHDYGEPSQRHLDETWHGYTRAHYDDEHADDPTLHDHFYKRPNGTHSQEAAPRWCPGYGEGVCTSKSTQDKIHDLAQQTWDVENQRMFHPEDDQADAQRRHEQMSGFLGDYALEHPDRVLPWHADGSVGEPDDPRLKGC